jgi:hypothetical protein
VRLRLRNLLQGGLLFAMFCLRKSESLPALDKTVAALLLDVIFFFL